MAIINLGRARMAFKGAWDASTHYAKLDGVEHNGSSYVAIEDVPLGTTPPDVDYWQLLAQKGDQGLQGPQGIQGPEGTTPEHTHAWDEITGKPSVWHSGNDGANSGLDADKLDGQHASYFTSYTDTAVAALLGSAPGTLDTLNELAAALGDDPNFATTVTNSIAEKLPLTGGTITSGHDVALTLKHNDFGDGLVIHRNDPNNAPAIKFKNNTKQTGILYADNGDNLRFKRGTSDTGNIIWHEGNDGAGSGLDADKLDGQDASAFASASHNHDADYMGKGFMRGASVVFTVDGDADTYYPVTFGNLGNTGYGFNTYSVSRWYGSTAPDTWHTATHKGGLTFTWQWTRDGAWGGNDKDFRVVKWDETYSTMVGGLQNGVGGGGMYGGVVLWLRGGGAVYEFHSPAGAEANVKVHLTTVTASNGTTYSPRTSNASAAGEINHRYPIRDQAKLYDEGNRVLTTASEGSGNGLDADTVDGIHGSSFLRTDANNGSKVATFGPNSTYGKYLKIGNNANLGDANTASIGVTNGNLHIDAADGYTTYLNYYGGTGGVSFGNGSSSTVAFMGPDGDLWKGGADNTGSKYWHAGNDGSGSGLDADLLDGKQATDFVAATGDTMTGNLVLQGSSVSVIQTLAATSNYGTGIEWLKGGVSQNTYDPQIGHHNTGGSGTGSITILPYPTATSPWAGTVGLHLWQTGIKFNNNTVWHAGNDGSGSGLDADKLDGVHGSSFLRSDATDTATGAITFTSNSLKLSGHWYSNFYTGTQNYIHLYPGGHSGAATTTDIRAWNGSSADTFQIKGGDNNGVKWRGNKLWHAGNDGSGSGLDADKLDGKEASAFFEKSGGTLTGTLNYRMLSGQTTSNLDTAGDSSGFSVFYGTSSATNKPSGTDHAVATFSYSSAWQTQLAMDWRTKNMYFRTQENGTWKSWSKIWHDGNDGVSSGLNADLLDGKHASTTRNSANTIPVRDGNGYLQLGWINTTSGQTTSTINKIYASDDNYVRYITPATLISQLGLWTSGNDGAGSGLDADKLDGLHQSTFMRRSANSQLDMNNNDIVGVDQIIHEGDSNTYMQFHAADQWRVVTGGTERLEVNNSTITAGVPIVSTSNITAKGNMYVGTNGGGDSNIYCYDDNSNTWRTLQWHDGNNEWRVEDNNGVFYRLWHAGNDGAGSGLDADKVDGIHATSFLRKDNVNNGSTIIRVDDADFVVMDNNDATTKYIWRAHNAKKLYLGTADAVPTTRADMVTNGGDAYFHEGNSAAPKAWVNWKNKSGNSLVASYNVSSVTDNYTGVFTTNFSNSFASATYASAGSVNTGNTPDTAAISFNTSSGGNTYTTSACGHAVENLDAGYTDYANNTVTYVGN